MNKEVDKRLINAKKKTKFVTDTSWTEAHEGSLYFWRNRQLTKGKIGEIRADAIYYWSEREGMTEYPSSHRMPVYRSDTPRKLPKTLQGIYNF